MIERVSQQDFNNPQSAIYTQHDFGNFNVTDWKAASAEFFEQLSTVLPAPLILYVVDDNNDDQTYWWIA